MFVKVCGITQLEDAMDASLLQGCDYSLETELIQG